MPCRMVRDPGAKKGREMLALPSLSGKGRGFQNPEGDIPRGEGCCTERMPATGSCGAYGVLCYVSCFLCLDLSLDREPPEGKGARSSLRFAQHLVSVQYIQTLPCSMRNAFVTVFL